MSRGKLSGDCYQHIADAQAIIESLAELCEADEQAANGLTADQTDRAWRLLGAASRMLDVAMSAHTQLSAPSQPRKAAGSALTEARQ